MADHYTYSIVEGRSLDGERVFRVVEYINGECQGGLGSYFRYSDAQSRVEAELEVHRG